MTRTALHGRLKVAVRAAVEACGSVEGAGATAGRGKSTAGRWHALSEPDLPTIDAAAEMDKVAVARGVAPPIAGALARELGAVLVMVPSAPPSRGDWHGLIATMAAEHGDLLAGLLRDIADHRISRAEAEARRRDAATLLTVIADIDTALCAIAEGRES